MTTVALFDSGLGGLTVAREVVRQMPCANIEFYGDNGRIPYFPLPHAEIHRYSRQILDFLAGKGVDLAIIACNTATATSLDAVKDAYDFPVIGVIEPGAKAALEVSKRKMIGVIATPFTTQNGAYAKTISRLDPTAKVLGQACPMFTLLVEAGRVETQEAADAAREYLSVFRDSGIDTMVLGCTHYPVMIQHVVPNIPQGVRIVDPAVETVKLAKSMLGDKYSESAGCAPTRRFYTSGDPELFERLGSSILGSPTGKVERVVFE